MVSSMLGRRSVGRCLQEPRAGYAVPTCGTQRRPAYIRYMRHKDSKWAGVLALMLGSVMGVLPSIVTAASDRADELTFDALELVPVWLNGSPAIQFVVAGQRDGVGTMLVEDGVVTRLFLVRNPDKLDRVGSLVDLSRGGVQGPTRGGI